MTVLDMFGLNYVVERRKLLMDHRAGEGNILVRDFETHLRNTALKV
jgi:hypothetical protein